MALDESSNGPGTPFFHHARNKKAPIPRKLVEISPDQKELLNCDDAWEENLENGVNGLVNVPKNILNDLIHFHYAHIPPPAAQKPPTSSTSAPTNSGTGEKSVSIQTIEASGEEVVNTDALGAPNSPKSSEKDDEDDDGGSEVSWSASDHSVEPRNKGRVDNGAAIGEVDTNPPASGMNSPPAPAPCSIPPNNAILPQDSNTESQISQPTRFMSQVPMPSIPDDVHEDSSLQQTTSITTENKHSPQAPKRHPPPIYPSSSAGPEDLDMEIPGVLPNAAAPPPVNRIALATQTRQATGAADTPPCGEGSTIQSADGVTSTSDAQPIRIRESPVQETERRSRSESSRKPSPSKPTGQRFSVSNKRKMKAVTFGENSDQDQGADVLEVEDTPFHKYLPRRVALAPLGPGGSSASQQSVVPSTFPTGKPSPTVEMPVKEEETQEPDIGMIPEAPTINQRASSPVEDVMPRNERGSQIHDRSSLGIEHLGFATPRTADVNRTGPPSSAGGGAGVLPGTRDRFLHSPLETFCRAYPSFRGSLDDFVRACMSAQSLQQELRLPPFLYDDFIRAFCDGYVRYIEETEYDEPLDAMEWYVENVPQPRFSKGVVDTANLGCVFDVYIAEYEAARRDLATTASPAPREASMRFSSCSLTGRRRKPPTPRVEGSKRSSLREELQVADSPTAHEGLGSSPPVGPVAEMPSAKRGISPPPRSSKRRKTITPPDVAGTSSRDPKPIPGPRPGPSRTATTSSNDQAQIQGQYSESRSNASSFRAANVPPVVNGKSDRTVSNGAIGNGAPRETARPEPPRRIASAPGTKGQDVVAAPPRPSFSKPATPSTEAPAKKPTSRMLPPTFTGRSRDSNHDRRSSGKAESIAASSDAPSAVSRTRGVSKKSKKKLTIEAYKDRLQQMVASGRLSR